MSKPESIMIDNVKYVRAGSMPKMAETGGMEYVIVRCRNAGVHAGYLKERNSDTLELVNSRRLWRWWSKFTLSGLAMCGVLKGKESEVKFACVLPKLILTCSDVGEVILCTEVARKSIEAIPQHSND